MKEFFFEKKKKEKKPAKSHIKLKSESQNHPESQKKQSKKIKKGKLDQDFNDANQDNSFRRIKP